MAVALGTLALYPLTADGNDTSGNGRHLTVVGSPPFGVVAGEACATCSKGGLNYFLAPAGLNNALAGLPNWTLEGYVYMTPGDGAGINRFFWYLGSGQGEVIGLTSGGSSGAIRYGRQGDVLDGGSLAEGTRKHVAVVGYLGSRYIYTNNALVATKASFGAAPNVPVLGFGANTASPTNNGFGGSLHGLRISGVRRTSFPTTDTTDNLAISSATENSLNLSFTNTAGASRFLFYVSTTDDFSAATLSAVAASAATSATISGLSSGTTYYVFGRAELDGVSTAFTNRATGATLSIVAPTNLATGTPTSSSIPLTWTDAATPAAFYDVYQSDGEFGTYTLSEVATQGDGAVTIYGLTADTTYWFKLKARSTSGGTSAFSSAVTASTTLASGIPDTPTSLVASAIGRESIRITWTDASGTEAQLIYRHTEDSFGAASVIGGVDAGEQLYTDNGLASGTQYFYWLLPLGTGGPGTQTSSVNATTYGAAGNPGTDIVSQIVTAAKTRLTAVLSSDFEQLKYVKDLKKNGRTPWGYGVLIGDEEPTEPSVFGSYTAEMALQVVLYRAPNAIQNDRDIEEAELTLEQWKDRVHREFTTTRLYENDVIVLISDPSVTPEYFEDSEAVALRLTFPVKYRNSRA